MNLEERMFGSFLWSITCFFFSHQKLWKSTERRDEWRVVRWVNTAMKCSRCYFFPWFNLLQCPLCSYFIHLFERIGDDSWNRLKTRTQLSMGFEGIQKHSHFSHRLNIRSSAGSSSPFNLESNIQWNSALGRVVMGRILSYHHFIPRQNIPLLHYNPFPLPLHNGRQKHILAMTWRVAHLVNT